MARVIEEEPTEKVVVHEREREVVPRDRGSNAGWIAAVIIVLLLLLLLFGRGLFGGSSDSGGTDVNVSPSTSEVGQ